LKKLHDLLVLRITHEDKERKEFPLAEIVGKRGIEWDTEVPVDKGWIDIYVPIQKRIEQPYIIEVETGYDLDCSQILRKFQRFVNASMERKISEVAGVDWSIQAYGLPTETRLPKLCVVIPPDFAEFAPLFRAKEISVFLWQGTVEWECPNCKEITIGSGPWKPLICNSDSCNKKQRNFRLVGLADFGIKRADV
jgi:hypothetical protein